MKWRGSRSNAFVAWSFCHIPTVFNLLAHSLATWIATSELCVSSLLHKSADAVGDGR